MSITDELAVDDVVVVPTYGLCRVDTIEEKEQYGCEDVYYTFRSCNTAHTGTTTLPAAQVRKQGVRWPSNPGYMLEVLEHLRDKRRGVSGNPNVRERHFRGQIKHADPRVLAECVRDLWVPEGTERSYIYMTLYEQALDRLALEVAFVFEEPVQDVRGKIESITGSRLAPEDLFGSKAKAVSEQ